MKLTQDQIIALRQEEARRRRVLLNNLIVNAREAGDPVPLHEIQTMYYELQLKHRGFDG